MRVPSDNMTNANDRESRILNALPIANQEGRRAHRKFRKIRAENSDDFVSIAYVILIRATDYCISKGWDNSEAWIRVQIRRNLNRYVERRGDDLHCRVKEYLLDWQPWDYSGLIDIARRINKDKRSRNKAKCKSRAAKRAEMIEFYGPHFF